MQTNTTISQAPPAAANESKVNILLPPGGVALAEVERELVRQAMERTGGNQTHAAELLGIERDALRRRLIKYGFLGERTAADSGLN